MSASARRTAGIGIAVRRRAPRSDGPHEPVASRGCRADDAESVVQRLDERFAVAYGGELGPVELRLFRPDAASLTLASLMPRITSHFFGISVVPMDHRCPVPEPRPQRSGNAQDFVAAGK